MRKRIVVLGASGCIGRQTLDVISQHRNLYELTGISIGRNTEFLEEFLKNNEVAHVCMINEADMVRFAEKYPDIRFYCGTEGLNAISALEGTDVLFNAIQGFDGLMPTITAIRRGIDVAVANKESLIAAGDIVVREAEEHGVSLIPIDSEHSAIFQCMNGYRYEDVRKLIITASGGAFRNLSRAELENVTREDALRHPKWNMGHKITIDSATMMNKGFEVIEAHVLFGLPYEQIETVIHPESIVHSMVEFKDHSVLAELAVADMRVAIQYALSYPRKIDNSTESLDLCKLGSLNFKPMDTERFPLVDLAYKAGKMGGNMPAILNGANELVVDSFLEGKCRFIDIERINFEVCQKGEEIYKKDCSLEDIIYANSWATQQAQNIIDSLEGE
ncbi:MAG: 1-deoxy-D-xylulose-5-phosphate reductoisomerase [Erysipelotrichaceae bacterium]|nr:1-deoxy-D-xylulose-5-phosphate reductoisomerase [Erysipelotrichaceae bacterium]